VSQQEVSKVSFYIQQLKASLAVEEQQQRLDRSRVADAAVKERLTPLENRLARLLTTIPPEVQKEGLSLPALQKALRGRWRGSCHPGELGAALRKLGFVRERQWGGSDGFQAVWRKTG